MDQFTKWDAGRKQLCMLDLFHDQNGEHLCTQDPLDWVLVPSLPCILMLLLLSHLIAAMDGSVFQPAEQRASVWWASSKDVYFPSLPTGNLSFFFLLMYIIYIYIYISIYIYIHLCPGALSVVSHNSPASNFWNHLYQSTLSFSRILAARWEIHRLGKHSKWKLCLHSSSTFNTRAFCGAGS